MWVSNIEKSFSSVLYKKNQSFLEKIMGSRDENQGRKGESSRVMRKESTNREQRKERHAKQRELDSNFLKQRITWRLKTNVKKEKKQGGRNEEQCQVQV